MYLNSPKGNIESSIVFLRLVGEHDLTSKSVGDCRESTYGQLSAIG